MEASTSQRGAFARRRILYRGAVFAFAAGSIAYGAALFACGGTTGREGLTTPDASVAGDDGGFDAGIQYIDRLLPDLYVAPIEAAAGGEGGSASCAPDLPVLVPLDNSGNPVYDAGFAVNPDGSTTYTLDGAPDVALPGLYFEVPAVWPVDGGDSGVEVPAPDGSACETQVWLGSPSCDFCVRNLGGFAGPVWSAYGENVFLPPCSDLANAGLAVAGPGASKPRLALCQAMYQCILSTQCFAEGQSASHQSGNACICKPGDDCTMVGPTGVCAAPIQAAAEVQGSGPGDTFIQIGHAYDHADLMPADPGHAAGSLGALFNGIVANCLPVCTGDAGSH
jgi:hypothetical protein